MCVCVCMCKGPWCVCACMCVRARGVCVCMCESPWYACVCMCVRPHGVRVCDLRGNRQAVLLLSQAAQPWRAALIRASLGGAGGVMMEWRWQALGTEVWGRVTPLLPCSRAQRGRERGRGGSFRNSPAFWTAGVYFLPRACSHINP